MTFLGTYLEERQQLLSGMNQGYAAQKQTRKGQHLTSEAS